MIIELILWIVKVVYFILPGVFANIIPVIIKKNFKVLASPLDFNMKLKGKRIFGKNKTFRGLLFGVLSSIAIAGIQTVLYQNPAFRNISLQDYSTTNFVLFGFFIGFGSLLGDLINSFVKRRLDIKSGSKFMPWDQLNAPIGGIVFASWVYNGDKFWVLIISVIVIAFALHLINRTIAYYLKISDERW